MPWPDGLQAQICRVRRNSVSRMMQAALMEHTNASCHGCQLTPTAEVCSALQEIAVTLLPAHHKASCLQAPAQI